MRRTTVAWVGAGVVWLAGGLTLHAAEAVAPDQLARLQALVKPAAGGEDWLRIPWLTSLWEARRQAAAQGKPVLLWVVDGQPLACTLNHGVAGPALVFS